MPVRLLPLVVVHFLVRSHNTWAALTYPAMHEEENSIQLFAAAKCPKIDILPCTANS